MRLGGVGHAVERQLRLVLAHLLRGRVKEHDLADTRRRQLALPAGKGQQMEVADRAAREAAKLQVDPARTGVRQLQGLSVDRFQGRGGHHIAGRELHR
ncbi:hypothetical protein D3C78_1707930 [compost metagenome]